MLIAAARRRWLLPAESRHRSRRPNTGLTRATLHQNARDNCRPASTNETRANIKENQTPPDARQTPPSPPNGGEDFWIHGWTLIGDG